MLSRAASRGGKAAKRIVTGVGSAAAASYGAAYYHTDRENGERELEQMPVFYAWAYTNMMPKVFNGSISLHECRYFITVTAEGI